MTVPPSRRRLLDLVAMIAIGVAVVGAALLPAVTANSGERITVRGDVRVDGKPVPFLQVGFWTFAQGTIAHTITDANGGFTMDVRATSDGYAWAGVAPDADRAIVRTGGEEVVRGVIGGYIPSLQSTPLYQGFPTTTARALDTKGPLRFKLQHPGRIAGASPVPASRLASLQVRRLDGSVVRTLRPDRRGRFASGSLATGVYAVVATPRSPDLPVVAAATVGSGTTTTVRLGAPVRGGTLDGVVRDEDGPVGAGVPVLVERDGHLVAAAATTAGGRYSVPGLPSGAYAVEVGRTKPRAARPAAPAVPIPGRTSTPEPAATPAPTPAPAPTDAASAALVPAEATSDRVLPRSVPVDVPPTLGTVTTDVVVDAAARLAGTAAGAAGDPVQVVVEDAATGQVVRAAAADARGRYSVGGLVPGTAYEVRAVTRPSDPALARMGSTPAVAAAGTTTGVDVELDRGALTVTGSVAGATGGRVAIGDPALLQRTGPVGADGRFTVGGLVPGALPATVTVPDHLVSDPQAAVLDEDAPAPLTLQPGPLPAAVKAWFISGGAGVPVVRGSATDAAGRTVRIGGARRGHVTVEGLRPSTYAFDPDGFEGTAATVDGPWWFLPPTGSFSLSASATTDLGPVVLHVRQR